jgi:RNA polymerase sigma-70 factor (ECF subfamily)
MSTVVSRLLQAAPAGVGESETAESVQLARLVSRIAAGDRSAFAELFDVTSGRLVAAMRSRLRRPDQAAEVAAETFVEVWWMARHHVDGSGDAVAAWLVDIAARRAEDRMRRERADQDRPAGLGSAAKALLADVQGPRTSLMLAWLLSRPGAPMS